MKKMIVALLLIHHITYNMDPTNQAHQISIKDLIPSRFVNGTGTASLTNLLGI